MAKRWAVLALILMATLVAGCGDGKSAAPAAAQAQPADTPSAPTGTSVATASAKQIATQTATASPTATALPTASATASATPTDTPTPSPTATPTPTAPPVSLSGDAREMLLSAPEPQNDAPCGVVDTLDFPLYPPDARSAFGGRDFGVFRSRYNGHHTGEDWWSGGRGASFGLPVYSIGHGTVTYAAPLGWGVDQGVVIARHVFPDGSSVLSFYGHLDPPSVILRAGECVARGDQVGQIGRPSSPPHLHFEIRTHMPNGAGPGYWSVDPTLAGWQPPSQTISNYRIVSSLGVQWTQPSTARGTKGLGTLDDGTFVATADELLIGINLQDGSLRWSKPISNRATDAYLDKERSVIYIATQFGRIEAWRLVDKQAEDAGGASEPAVEREWQIKLDAIGSSIVMPLPDEGIAISYRRKMFGVSPDGELRWEQDLDGRMSEWALADDRLLFSTSSRNGSIWQVSDAEPTLLTAQVGGRPVFTGDQVLVYEKNGLYRLQPETSAPELLYALPRGSVTLGDMVPLPGGGFLVAHKDRADSRLIALNADGLVRWQRSLHNVVRGQQRLLLLDGRAYLVTQDATSALSEVSILAVDLDNADLARIFTGGTRNPSARDTWVFPIGNDRILINIGGSSLVALDLRAALEAMLQVANSR